MKSNAEKNTGVTFIGQTHLAKDITRFYGRKFMEKHGLQSYGVASNVADLLSTPDLVEVFRSSSSVKSQESVEHGGISTVSGGGRTTTLAAGPRRA